MHLIWRDTAAAAAAAAAKVTWVMFDSATLWTVARQAPLSMGFSRQEYWSGLPWPPPGESSPSRDRTHVSYISCIDRRVLHHYRHLGSPIEK